MSALSKLEQNLYAKLNKYMVIKNDSLIVYNILITEYLMNTPYMPIWLVLAVMSFFFGMDILLITSPSVLNYA